MSRAGPASLSPSRLSPARGGTPARFRSSTAPQPPTEASRLGDHSLSFVGGYGGSSTIRSVIKEKQRELETVTDGRVSQLEQRTRDLEEVLRARDEEIERIRTALATTEQDFNYNVGLVRERDAELDRLERELTNANRLAVDHEERVRRAELRADDVQRRYTEDINRARDETQALQDHLRKELENARGDAEAEIARVRTEVTRTGDAQIRNARAAEAEMKRKVDAYGLENDRLREANDALQQQLRTAQSAGDGAVKSMREVESAYAALEGEVTRVKASLTREQEEHAATKRSLQRTVNELKESGDAKEALAARARTLENEAREAEQRATYAEAEANEWRGRGRAAEAAVKDGEALHQQQVQRAAMSVDSMTEDLNEARRVREAIEHELTKTREALERATMEARDASRMAQTHHAKYEAALTDEQRNLAHWRSEFDRISLVSDDQATEIRSLTDRVLTAEDRVAHLTHALDQARRQVVEDARVHEHQAQARWNQEITLLNDRLHARDREHAALERRCLAAESELEHVRHRLHTAELDLIHNRATYATHYPYPYYPTATADSVLPPSPHVHLYHTRDAVNKLGAKSGENTSATSSRVTTPTATGDMAHAVRDMAVHNSRLRYDLEDIKDRLNRSLVQSARSAATTASPTRRRPESTGKPYWGMSEGSGLHAPSRRDDERRRLDGITRDLATSPAVGAAGVPLLSQAGLDPPTHLEAAKLASPRRGLRVDGPFDFGDNLTKERSDPANPTMNSNRRPNLSLPGQSQPAPSDPTRRPGMWSVGDTTARRDSVLSPVRPVHMDLSGVRLDRLPEEMDPFDRARDRVEKAKHEIMDASRFDPAGGLQNPARGRVAPGTPWHGTELKTSKLDSLRKVLHDTRGVLDTL